MSPPLQAVTDDASDQNFRSLGTELGGIEGRLQSLEGLPTTKFGSAEIEWPGGAVASTALEVTHGLGTTPTAVVLTAADTAVNMGTTAVGATKFTVQGEHIQGTKPAGGTKTKFYWVAIG